MCICIFWHVCSTMLVMLQEDHLPWEGASFSFHNDIFIQNFLLVHLFPAPNISLIPPCVCSHPARWLLLQIYPVFVFVFFFNDFPFNCLRCGEVLAWLRWCFSKTVNSKQEGQLISNPNTILHAHIYKPPGEQALLCSHSAHDAPCVHIFIVFTVA